MRKNELIVFFAVMFVITLVAFLKADFIEQHGIVAQVWVTVILVLLTAAYVSRVRQQANASVKMANEMREQIHNTLRPIVDIMVEAKQNDLAKLVYGGQEVPCRLRNIGVGPAIDVHSFIMDADGEPRQWDFDVIPVPIGEGEMGYTHEMRLCFVQREGHEALVVRYKDVYDNHFESYREVTRDEKGKFKKIGSLKILPLPKGSGFGEEDYDANRL